MGCRVLSERWVKGWATHGASREHFFQERTGRRTTVKSQHRSFARQECAKFQQVFFYPQFLFPHLFLEMQVIVPSFHFPLG